MTAIGFYFVYLGTLLVAAIVALLIYTRVNREYHTLMYFIWTVSVLEVVQTFYDSEKVVSNVIGNARYLVDFLFVAVIAYRWKVFEKHKALFGLLAGLGVLLWNIEKDINGWHASVSWCRVVLNLLITLIALALASRSIMLRTGSLWRNPVFLAAASMFIYYGTAMIVELIFFAGWTDWLLKSVAYVDLTAAIFSNIILLRSLLCIPTKPTYSLS